MDFKIKMPHAGFFLTLAAFVLTIVAFSLSLNVYAMLGYRLNRWVVFLTVGALWLMLFFLCNGLFMGDRPFWVAPLYAVVGLFLTFAALLFIQPCMTPIGIYFTVGNMGDAATNAVAVPRAITAVALYVAALVLFIVAAFCPTVVERTSEKIKKGSVE